jgi:aspartyl-tRNA(Asn)/glutamyl-tRNA(Gln) amidotransferase subunit A
MTSPNRYSITEAAALLRYKSFSALELMQACLDQIDRRESVVKAWVTIDREAALASAEQADLELARDRATPGPLHGIPFGVKDIFDVAGMPTTAGTEAYPLRVAEKDATSVARLKSAGAIVLGKTVTTAFAMGDAGPTTNPWNSAHTPGGSSSGSAAAVADRMCMAALGTQTAGSVIRPCSYNGLAGIKPTYAGIDIDGVIPLSWQLDHVGALTRNLDDARLLWNLLRDDGGWRPGEGNQVIAGGVKPQRLWRARGLFETEASAAMNSAIDTHCAQLEGQGVEIVERPFPDSFLEILDNHRIIMASEAAASHNANFQQHQALYPPNIKRLIEEGKQISAVEYSLALQHRKKAIDEMNDVLSDVDGMLSPAAVDSAPVGLTHTGDRTYNAPSSYLGLPVVTYPLSVDSNGLPLGAQIMGGSLNEDVLLQRGIWCEQVVGFDLSPQ